MAKHLGRNPFGKSKHESQTHFSDDSVSPVQEVNSSKGKRNPKGTAFREHPAKWLLVDLPADSITFALKTALLMKSVVKK